VVAPRVPDVVKLKVTVTAVAVAPTFVAGKVDGLAVAAEFTMVTVCGVELAAAYELLPGWLAVRVTVPAVW
jgi:hypothetical protein